jgi:hypothetical protein
MVLNSLESAYFSYLDKMKKFFIVLICLLVSSCTVRTKFIGGTYTPSLANNYEGLMFVELNDSYHVAEPYMLQECRPYGGLKQTSVQKTGAPPGFSGMNFGNTYWKYSCNGLSNSQNINIPVTSTIAPSYSPNKISLDEAKKKCSDLGLKAGTEGFGKCVLQLSK